MTANKTDIDIVAVPFSVCIKQHIIFFFTIFGFLPYKQKQNSYSFSTRNTTQVTFQAVTMLWNTYVYNPSSGPVTLIAN